MINRTVFGSWVQASVIAIAILGIPQSQAASLFNIDVTNDKLMLLDSATGGFNSSTVANLSTAGVVSVGVSSIEDMDGLSNGNGNPIELYGTDRTPGVNTLLFGINPATGTETIIGTYSDALRFHPVWKCRGMA